MKFKMRIDSYTHGVRVSNYTSEMYNIFRSYLRKLILSEPKNVPGGRIIMEEKKKYFGETSDQKEVYIHRYCLEDFLLHLEQNHIYKEQIEFMQVPVPMALPAEYVLFEKYVLRDYQETIKIDILRPIQSARVDLFTGYGKTLTSLATIAEMNCKFTVTIPPKYFGLWTKALDETYRSVQGRYMTISGSAALQNLIDRALDNDLDGIDIFIISNITYRTFIEAFELHGDKLSDIGYNVPPTRFHELLGVGCQINDEIQEDPGLLFRTDIFTNIAKQIYLSATPFTGNAYVTKMIDKMLPPETAVRLPDYKVYIKCLGLVYNEIGIKPKHYLTPFKNTYNHARYETQMLLNSKRHATYLRMVRKIAEGVYVNDRLEGQKLLILCATVAFIKDMVEYLRDQFPDLEVNEHVAGCPYERLLTNDITVSTIKSSGTGVDIPNLREVVLLQATGSEKDMIQILGRLRPLKLYPDVSPRLTYMICENIPHHIRYSGNTQTIFKDRTSESSIKRISVN